MKQDLMSHLPQPEKQSEQTCEGSKFDILGQVFLQIFQLQQKNNFYHKWSGEHF